MQRGRDGRLTAERRAAWRDLTWFSPVANDPGPVIGRVPRISRRFDLERHVEGHILRNHSVRTPMIWM